MNYFEQHKLKKLETKLRHARKCFRQLKRAVERLDFSYGKAQTEDITEEIETAKKLKP